MGHEHEFNIFHFRHQISESGPHQSETSKSNIWNSHLLKVSILIHVYFEPV